MVSVWDTVTVSIMVRVIVRVREVCKRIFDIFLHIGVEIVNESTLHPFYFFFPNKRSNIFLVKFAFFSRALQFALLQSSNLKKSFVRKWDGFITNWDGYYKAGWFYYKERRVIQSGTIITKWALTPW